MLRAMVHEHAPHILHAGAEQNIPKEDQEAHQPFRQAFPDGGDFACAEQERTDERGEHEEQPHGKADCQDHRKAHDHAFHGLAELLRQPFFKLCRLLVDLLADELRGFGERPHAHGERFHKSDYAAHDRQAKERALLRAGLLRLILRGDRPIRLAYRHRDARRGFHHHAFHYGLSADRTNLAHILISSERPEGRFPLRSPGCPGCFLYYSMNGTYRQPHNVKKD